MLHRPILITGTNPCPPKFGWGFTWWMENQNPHPKIANDAILGWGTRVVRAERDVVASRPDSVLLTSRHQAESYLGTVVVVVAGTAVDDAVVGDIDFNNVTASGHARGIELPRISGERRGLRG